MAEVLMVLEGKDMGVHIVLVDLMTGKYGITMKHILYDDQGLDINGFRELPMVICWLSQNDTI